MDHNDTHKIPYLPHTQADRESMLEAIGVKSFEDLVKHIPKDLRLDGLKIDSGLSELELSQAIAALASKNKPASKQMCFMGGGSYYRYVPAAVMQLVGRSEFATAYTPYQPEVSQGSLQAIYEFQSSICLLTGMDVANASMYDGPTACAEAGLMACRLTNRKKLVIAESVNPEYRMVTHSYAKACGIELTKAEKFLDGNCVDSECAALIIQYPDFFGSVEDLSGLSEKLKKDGVLLVVVTEPISLNLLTPPAEFGADIVVGDAQPCGNFLSFGGPSAGYMACRNDYVRQLPGRLAGITKDSEGKRAFTLTLQTREQHIRRARATSNICTNQALNALAMLVYLSVMGGSGLRQVAEISLQRANYLAEQLTKIDGAKLYFDKPFFNEFLLKIDCDVETFLGLMKERGILAGINVANMYPNIKDGILVAVTEMNTPEQLEKYISAFKECLSQAKDPKKVKVEALSK
ncbi:MAG: aminomethyl-transferring glycine dehydrogenase subunit GcvPA [Candidatus Melainabacteria bacterium]|nr:aminomethyl-transferring glycine dehydrogenase subunit GcvPA [Candidatus Melainabacteria bacterium]